MQRIEGETAASGKQRKHGELTDTCRLSPASFGVRARWGINLARLFHEVCSKARTLHGLNATRYGDFVSPRMSSSFCAVARPTIRWSLWSLRVRSRHRSHSSCVVPQYTCTDLAAVVRIPHIIGCNLEAQPDLLG